MKAHATTQQAKTASPGAFNPRNSNPSVTVSPQIDKVLRLPQVEDSTGLKKSTIYAKIKLNEFPAPLDLGGGRRGWRQSHVQAWIDSLEAAQSC